MKTNYFIYKIIALIIAIMTFQSCALLLNETEREQWNEFRENFGLPSSQDNPLSWNYIFPKQTLGLSAGIGLENELEETSICFGADYNYRLTNDISRRSAWYLRGSAHYSNTTFDDNKWNNFSVGFKPHIQIPITPQREGQLTIGGNLSYDTGSQEFGSFKEDFSGLRYGLFAGINIRANEKFSWGVEFPFLSHIDYTFKPEGGGNDVNVSETSLILNKHNPVMLYARFSLGGNYKSE